MGSVILLSGPVGAGKSTVASELVSALPGPVACIEGDMFWSFIAKSDQHDRRENFGVIMRAMTAAALPFARSGYDVVLDFSVPPQFLIVARKILKEVPLDYIVLRPSQAVCAGRAAARAEGAIPDYSKYRELYSLFAGADRYTISDDEAPADCVAMRIVEGLNQGRFRVS